MKTITNKEILEQLLREYDLEDFFPQSLRSELTLLRYQKGQIICHQDQKISFLAYALGGNVKIVRRLSNGKEHVLESYKQPCIIGDIEILTNQKSVTSVIALEETYVIQLNNITKEKLLANPNFLYQISQELAKNFYKQNIKSTQNVTYTVKERLAKHILESQSDGHFQLNLPLLADSFGTSYRHLHRVINQLKQAEIIETKSFKNYQILNPKALTEMAEWD